MDQEKLRRQAAQRRLTDDKVDGIAEALGRSDRWVRKWVARYQDNPGDQAWAASRSLAPRRSPQRTPDRVRQPVLEARARLEASSRAQYGALAILWELRRAGWAPCSLIRPVFLGSRLLVSSCLRPPAEWPVTVVALNGQLLPLQKRSPPSYPARQSLELPPVVAVVASLLVRSRDAYVINRGRRSPTMRPPMAPVPAMPATAPTSAPMMIPMQLVENMLAHPPTPSATQSSLLLLVANDPHPGHRGLDGLKSLTVF